VVRDEPKTAPVDACRIDATGRTEQPNTTST
jgi:DNA gyrase inhibitor GyrI